jgi:Protein of unknown function (DUF3043)
MRATIGMAYQDYAVRVFRRRSAGAPDDTAQDSPGAQSPGSPADTRVRPAAETGKGRPTPKRKEAEAGRYQPIGGSSRRPSGPRTPATKAQEKTDRARNYDAMKRGEDWALRAKDKGPVRALVRDYVDARRTFTEYVMYILLLMVVALVIRNKAITNYLFLVEISVIVIVAIEGMFINRGVRKIVAERLPGESSRGLAFYATARAFNPRRFRVPTPRVSPGTKILWNTGTSAHPA